MVKRVDRLTPEQEAQMKPWADKWIKIGLSTERANRPKFEEAVRECYRAAGLPEPKVIVWVSSPMVGAFAAPYAQWILNNRLNKKGGAVRGAVRGAVDDAVDDAVRGAVRDAVDDAVGGAVGGAVRDAVDDAVGGAVGGAVDDAVDDAVGGAVGGAVDDAVGGAVGGAVRGAVGGAVGGAVDDAVDDAVGGAVGDAVRDAVGGAVDDAVGGAVDDAVGDAVDALNYIKDRRYNRMGGQFWVGWGYWYGSPSMASFFQDVCDLDLGEDINKRARAYQATSESACWWWPYSDFCMVSERPEIIHLENGRLSSDHEMAIRWPDGWGLYFLDGVRFEKDEWEKIVNQEFMLEDLAQKSMGSDKSAVAIKYLRPDRLLEHCKAKLIHTGIKGTELYRVDNFMNTRRTQYCMRMKHPTIDREYIEWVHPDVGKQGDADLAQCASWRDRDGNPIPLEDYLLAISA